MYRIYRVLKKDIYIVEEQCGKKWKKVGEYPELTLFDCTFRVYEKRRQMCVKDGKRNVHAYCYADRFVVGSPAKWSFDYDKVFYNPFVHQFFETEVFKKRVDSANEVVLIRKDIFVKGIR